MPRPTYIETGRPYRPASCFMQFSVKDITLKQVHFSGGGGRIRFALSPRRGIIKVSCPAGRAWATVHRIVAFRWVRIHPPFLPPQKTAILTDGGFSWQGWPKWTSEEFLREKFEAEVQKIRRIYMFLELLKPKTKVGQNDSVFQFRVFCISAYLLVPHELFQPSIRAIAWLLVSTEYCSGSQFLCRRKLLFSRDPQGNPLLENQ